jgi:hypothetical protein
MRKIIYFICLLGILFFLTETNPTRSEYVTWVNEKTLNESKNVLARGVISLVGETVFEASTTHKDYHLFSVFTTDFSDVGKGKWKSIGVFNQFITFSQTE